MTESLDIEFSGERTLVVRAAGKLDRDLSRVLLRVVATAVAERVPRLHVDLAGVRSCTVEAAVAVSGCRRPADLTPDRVVVTGAP